MRNLYVLGHYLLELCQLVQWEEQRYGLSYKLWSIILYPVAKAFFLPFWWKYFTACVQPRGNISFLAWPKKSLDILKLVIAQRELAWQWDLFDFRILQDCKVCCAVLNHRLVGCIVQHILREELTKLLPSKTPPCNARNPRSSSQRSFLFYFNQHLLYMSMSGFQRALGGILISSTLPYSEEFHFKLESVHSWWQTNFPHKMLDKTLPDTLPTCLNEILSAITPL